ncbi:TIGR02679 family protein [Actinokineospora sp. 24-640]
MSDIERLRRLLGTPATARLLARLRRRVELGRPLTGTVTLSDASPDERRAVEQILGRRAGLGASVTVPLDELDAVLRRADIVPAGLAHAVALLVGEIPGPAERATEQAAWASALAQADELAERRPRLWPWREWLAATGMVRRLEPDARRAAELVARAVRVVDALPSTGVALRTLAAERAGGSHALDHGRPLATLVLAAARVLAGEAPSGSGVAAERQAAWARVGVYRDALSSWVLCAGLPGGTGTTTARALAVAGEGGEPVVLTLRQLAGERPDCGVGARRVWVCENPIVVATAADELGAHCPPLVCLGGQPSTAVLTLLDLLAAGGATFSYHGDFDWGGLRIANTLAGSVAWRPWRFDAAAYRAALETTTGDALTGKPVQASWDRDLTAAMADAGRRVEEETVLADLMGDLRAG